MNNSDIPVIVYSKKELNAIFELIKVVKNVLYVPKRHIRSVRPNNRRRTPYYPPLKESEDSFSSRRKLTDTEEKERKKKVNSILNKITLKNMGSLKTELVGLIIEDSMIEEIVDMIFEKALFEAFFAEVHATLTIELNKEFGCKKIRGLMLNKCHKEFQTGITPDLDEQGKQRMRGNIRFIGQLYVRGFIIDRIMSECINHLIKGECHEDLEAMCLLMKNIIDKYPIENYFKIMTAMSKDKKYSSRIRFMMMDVVDLKK